MLILKIDELLKQKEKTRYWLSKQCDISQNNIAKICNNETTSIKFDTIEKICKALDCTLNDLVESDDPQMHRLLLYYAKHKDIKNQGDTSK